MAPDLNSTRFAAALACHEAGRPDDARTLYRAILADEPGHAESLHLLGLITAQSGELQAGEAMIRRAMALRPGCAPHHNSLALVCRLSGHDTEAVEQYRAAAMLRPGSAEIHNNLATTLRALGRNEDAIAAYRVAAALAPDTAEIWYNLASTLVEHDQTNEVEFGFLRALTLRPAYVDALANFGRWLISRARWSEAETRLNAALRLAPGDARCWNNLGVTQQETGRRQQAETCYRQSLALDPEFADAHYNLGCLRFGDGHTDEAIACHKAAILANPLHGAARLALCMAHLPILYQNQTEIAERRNDYLTALDALAAAVDDPPVALAVSAAIGTSQPFFLAYQQQNDRAPQAIYGRLLCRLLAAPEAGPPAAEDAIIPAQSSRPQRTRRIRLGIVSGYFLDHTISRLFLQGWLAELDRDRFEVTAFHTGRTSDAETGRAATSCDRFVHGLLSPAGWRRALTGTRPDVLLYPEIGMDPTAAQLAAQRLAPVQCVSWGHPETTGLPTMDYFLTADLMEPAHGAAHYTEQLVRLPGLGMHYTPGANPALTLDRISLGLDPGLPVFWSGQSLYKYLPLYDQVFPRIAAATGPCQFVFIGFAKSDAVTAAFQDRLSRAFAAYGLEASRYCVILPPMPQQRFIAAVGLADVILDTTGWSGGRSTLDCLAQDPAIVTFPGEFMRARHTTAILRQIGCTETIAQSLDDYVSIAARLATDAAWRAHVRRDVSLGKQRAFRDTGPIRALEAFLAEAVSRL